MSKGNFTHFFCAFINIYAKFTPFLWVLHLKLVILGLLFYTNYGKYNRLYYTSYRSCSGRNL